MKKVINLVMLLIVTAIGFYFGYRQATSLKPMSNIKGAKIAQIPSTFPDKIIRFEYILLDRNSFNRHGVNIDWERSENGNPEYMIYQGDDSLWGLLGNQNITSYSLNDIELEPSLKSKVYKYYLKFPVKEPKDNVLKFLIHELGLTCSSTESLISKYQFSWGDQPIIFPSTMKEGGRTIETKTDIDRKKVLTKQEVTFENIDIPGLLSLCNYQGNDPNVSFEELQQILKNSMNVDLKIVEIKSKKLLVKK